MTKSKAFLLEAVQFVPVITLASSFLVSGDVDMGRAAPLFIVSAALAVLITTPLFLKKVLLNPILVGSNVWLLAGAAAFGIPVLPLAELLGSVQAAGLFAAILVTGGGYHLKRPDGGFIGLPGGDPGVVKRLSLLLLVLSGVAFAWSLYCGDDLRLGGGLPFILLNVSRRMLIRRSRRG